MGAFPLTLLLENLEYVNPGGSTVNRGHAHHRSIRPCRVRAGRPRRLGGAQRDNGTCKDSSAWIVQPWSVIPAALAGGVCGVRDTLSWGVQQFSTVPTKTMPSGSVIGWRARARHRRASGARRSRNVAVSRSMSAVLLPPPPCERQRSVSTRAGGPAPRRRSVSMPRRRS